MAAMPTPSSSSSRLAAANASLNLPAGFRFHPTDEELIVHYLMNQAAGIPFLVPIIAEVNIYQCNPWELPAKALFGDSEWYFFSPRERKYPNGARPNRAAGSGYWKATGTDKAIVSTATDQHIGVKKALVFYGGRPPRGVKTDWIMHEYRLVAAADGKTAATPARRRAGSMRLDDWVLCRIHKKSNDFQLMSSDQEQEGSLTVEQESPESGPLDQHDDEFQFHQTMTTMSKSCSLTDLLNSIDCSALSQLLDGGPPAAAADGGEDLPALSQLLDGPPAAAADGGEALPPPPPPPPQQQDPPLIYPTTTHETHQSLNNSNNNNLNNNNNHLINLPNADAACSDYVVDANNNNNCNNGVTNKRKRMMMTPAESYDDGSSKLNKVLPISRVGPGDSRNNSSSSYCNQQVVADTSGLFQSDSSSLLMSYPFPEMQ